MKRGLRRFEGAEWVERNRGEGRWFVIPSSTDPMGSAALRAQEAAAQEAADDLMAGVVLFPDAVRVRRADEYREAAE